MNKYFTKGQIAWLIILTVLVIDQVIKVWVKTHMYWHESIRVTDWCYIFFTENVGMAFQMVDDALDFAPESETGKPTGGDVREGKLTPPLRMYRESLSENERAAFDGAFAAGLMTAADAEAIAGRIRAAGYAFLCFPGKFYPRN